MDKYIQTNLNEYIWWDLDQFERVYLMGFGRRIRTSILRQIWPTHLDKSIQTDLADGFGQVYSNRFCRLIWTSIFRPKWQTDLDKYNQTSLVDCYGQVKLCFINTTICKSLYFFNQVSMIPPWIFADASKRMKRKKDIYFSSV